MTTPPKYNLIRRFAILSFVCIGVMAVALWFIVSDYLISQMLEREWETTADFVRAETSLTLAKEDFMSGDRHSVSDKFDGLHQHLTVMPDIVRFRVYDPHGVVIWSDEKRLQGQSFADNDELKEAIGGKVVADISSLTKKENVFEHASFQRLVEVYVPIYSGDQRELLGVIEVYKRAESIYRAIRQARVIVLVGVTGGGLLLYVCLFAIVRQAARKIVEQQDHLLRVQSELVASQRMAAIGEMAAAVAHGIGNPLSSIRAAAQVAKLDCDECQGQHLQEKTMATLEGIIQQVDRVQKRMRGLLNFAKPMEPRPGPVELNSLLHDIIEVLTPRFADAAVSPKMELDSSLPKLELDANHAEQIFMGIVTNALEATPKGGSVVIRTRRDSGNGKSPCVTVVIEDTGGGIPVENRQRIFEPFFTTKSHGTGIGLPLAKKFVERNGGEIAVSEGSSGGAKVEVRFPLSRANGRI